MIDFQALKQAVSIEQVADMLGLEMKQSGNQLRGACPACTSKNDRALVITPSKGVFYCFTKGKGGDLLALVTHIMDVELKDAAKFVADQLGTDTSNNTVTNTVKVSKERASFNPAQFLEKLQYTDEVKALGYSEAEARDFRMGFYRGHVYVPNVYQSGVIAGWSKLEGTLARPTTWIPDASNVIRLKAG